MDNKELNFVSEDGSITTVKDGSAIIDFIESLPWVTVYQVMAVFPHYAVLRLDKDIFNKAAGSDYFVVYMPITFSKDHNWRALDISDERYYKAVKFEEIFAVYDKLSVAVDTAREAEESL